MTPEEAMEELQGVGIPATKVQTIPELFSDPHLDSRSKLQKTPHPELGTTVLNGPSFQMSRQSGGIQRHPPLIGQDTEDVMRELLGLDDDAMVDAYVQGLLD